VGIITALRIMLLIDFLMTYASTSKRESYSDATKNNNIALLMRYAFLLLSFLIILQLTPSVVVASDSLGDPYKILGVSKHATIQDIRKAYKHLVKEW